MSKSVGETYAETFIAHWGIRGMKWGIRRKRGKDGTVGSTAKMVSENLSEDAARAMVLGAKARSGGTSSLSNREMRELIDRMNLQQNYARLIAPEAKAKSPMKTGIEWFADKGNKYGGVLADMYVREQLKLVSKQAPQLVPTPVKR